MFGQQTRQRVTRAAGSKWKDKAQGLLAAL
jgi:hypothetical protein